MTIPLYNGRMNNVEINPGAIVPNNVTSQGEYTRYGWRYNHAYAVTKTGEIVKAVENISNDMVDAFAIELADKFPARKHLITPGLGLVRQKAAEVEGYHFPTSVELNPQYATIWEECPLLMQLNPNVEPEIVNGERFVNLVWQEQTFKPDSTFKLFGQTLAVALVAIQGFDQCPGEVKNHVEKLGVYELWWKLCGLMKYTNNEREGVSMGMAHMATIQKSTLGLYQTRTEPVAIATHPITKKIGLVSHPHTNFPGDYHSTSALPGGKSRMIAVKTVPQTPIRASEY